MIVKQIIDEDFTNYKKESMIIGFPCCSLKCDKEFGLQVCQNDALAMSQDVSIDIETICDRYLQNPITCSIVCGGMEPFDSWNDLLQLVICIRKYSDDDIVIYTGYYENEIEEFIKKLKTFKNIIIKFGRFIPNQDKHYDKILGVELASDNQYAERIS